MSNKLAVQQSNIPALAMSEDELIQVLQDSVYPGAQVPSIKMIINVCKAAGKDPLKKPYHIVPMSVSTGEKDGQGWDIKKMRDVIMPGINDYRTDASRTGQHAGTSEPEFGDDVTEMLGQTSITYPKWCKVTVKRKLESGEVVEFTAKELWKENYATKSSKVDDPNAMWKRRPYAQIAKCAEAQALRKGFPEVGNQPTADEMEGKDYEVDVTPTGFTPKDEPKPVYYTDEEFHANTKAWKESITKTKTADRVIAFIETKGKHFTDEQRKEFLTWKYEPAVVDGEVIDDPFVTDIKNAEGEDK